MADDSNKVTQKTIAILAATSVELSPTIRALNLKRVGETFVGESPTCRVVAKVTGLGPTSAAASLLRLLDREKVAAIVSLGFAGGIERGLAVGESLDIWWIINEAGDVLDVRDRIPHPASNTSERTPQRTLLSVDRVIESVVSKRRLYEKHLAASVDMESFQLAKVAGALKLRFYPVRVVSDPADMALPQEAARWVTPAGEPDLRAVLRDLLRHPTWLGLLVRLHRHAKVCSEKLALRAREIVRREAGR